ncbi:T9SS type A sorting domain-containing protein [Cryomorphaceae bacterium 1068]|nr:T9SS type A sorting domain-containing protein [Cryomorphaceae bacterium 1068]
MKELTIIIFTILLLSFSSNAQWVQIGGDIDGEAAQDRSGSSVSMSSDGLTVAIGALSNGGNGANAGHVRVYRNISGVWTQIGSDIDGESEGDRSGTSVSVSADGTRVAISSPHHAGVNGTLSGQVRVYEEQDGDWNQVGSAMEGEAAMDEFGTEVSLNDDGTIVAIGAEGNDTDGNGFGHVRVFEVLGGEWIQMGSDIDGNSLSGPFGASLCLSGNGQVLAVGTRENNIVNGHVRVFQFDGDWIQVGSDIMGLSPGDLTGVSVRMSNDGTTLAMGAPLANGILPSSGVVRVFENTADEWTQVGSDISGAVGNERVGGFGGVSLSDDGATVVVAAKSFGNNRGKVRVFQNMNGEWIQQGEDILGESQGDQSGFSVDLSGDGNSLAIGAIFNAGSAPNAGHVRVYQMGTTGLSEIKLAQASVYPNPSDGEIRIDLNVLVENVTMHVFTIQGVHVHSENLGSIRSFTYSLPETSGLYFLQLVAQGGEVKTLKVVKE